MESNSVDIQKSNSWYSIYFPKAKVRLEDGSKVTALLDTAAKINVMNRKVIEDIGLAIRCGSKLGCVSHTSHNHSFFELYEDMEVAIRGLKTRHLIFVVEYRDQDLVFGQSFLNSVKFSQEYKPNGIFHTITHPQTQ